MLYAEFPDGETILINITLDIINDEADQTILVTGLKTFTQYTFRVRAYSFSDQNKTTIFTHIGIASDEIIVTTAEDGKITTLIFIYLLFSIYVRTCSARCP